MKITLPAVIYTILKKISIASFSVLAMHLAVQAQVSPGSQTLEPGQVSINNWVDRTALFPGDSLTYHLEIHVDTNMGILLDDIEGDELVLSGLELTASDIEVTVTDDGTSYHGRYHLSTFETGNAVLGIDELSVRYYFRRPGQRLENVAAAGEIRVPPVSVALQSTLPGDTASLGLRDRGRHNMLQSRGVGILGITLFLISVIPLFILLKRHLNKSELEQLTQHREEIIEETSAELLSLQSLDPDIPDQRLNGFNQLEQVIKEYFGTSLGIKTMSLTSSELSGKVHGINPSLPASDLGMILENCEIARYGKPDDLPSSESFNKGVMLVQGLLKD